MAKLKFRFNTMHTVGAIAGGAIGSFVQEYLPGLNDESLNPTDGSEPGNPYLGVGIEAVLGVGLGMLDNDFCRGAGAGMLGLAGYHLTQVVRFDTVACLTEAQKNADSSTPMASGIGNYLQGQHAIGAPVRPWVETRAVTGLDADGDPLPKGQQNVM